MRPLRGWLLLLVIAALMGAVQARAEEGGKDELHARLEALTVNLRGPEHRYLQVEITLNLAKAQSMERVKLYMPVIRHNMILLLTSKEPNRLETNAGKLKLMREAVNAANNAIDLTEKEGVNDVLFTAFVIQ